MNREKQVVRSRRLGGPRALGAALFVLAALALTAAPASASSSSCTDRTLEYPFVPWGDDGAYFLVPDGGFEGQGSGWTLAGGAKVVKGNEPYYVHSLDDRNALSLPAGSSATTAEVCVTANDPIFRFFAQNKGSLSASLRVDAVYRDSGGLTQTVTVGTVTLGSSKWSPSPQVHFLDSLTPLFSADGTASVRFRITPIKGLADGDWRIDDVYVDPLIWR